MDLSNRFWRDLALGEGFSVCRVLENGGRMSGGFLGRNESSDVWDLRISAEDIVSSEDCLVSAYLFRLTEAFSPQSDPLDKVGVVNLECT